MSESLFSPIRQILWDADAGVGAFGFVPEPRSEFVENVGDKSLAAVKQFETSGQLYGSDGKIGEAVVEALADAGFWGFCIDPRYGGAGASWRNLISLFTRLATVSHPLAGIGLVHHCVGPACAIGRFGTSSQCQRFLPTLAAGRRLGIFALTEPGAGSDLTALRTLAVRDGDRLLVRGEKVFITNAAPGRLASVVCLLEDRPAVLVCELPDRENTAFQFRDYGQHALKHTANRGLLFRDFPVPEENLLATEDGDGLTIAYHGLNRGRVALAANVAGLLRVLLADMVRWSHYRRTYGVPIGHRELVQSRIGQLAGLIVACDAVSAWCASLLDRGIRGELECITAKVFAAEALKTASIELALPTHGGRAFLHGHRLGDYLHNYLTPSIYEGENELLGLAFYASLQKHKNAKAPPATAGSMPIEDATQAANLPTAAAAFAAREQLRRMVEEICAEQQRGATLDQCWMADIAAQIQKAVVIMCASCYGAASGDDGTRQAADVVSELLLNDLLGRQADTALRQNVANLGKRVLDGDFRQIADVKGRDVTLPYQQ